MVEFGADVECSGLEGVTPLHLAAEYGCLEMIHMLVKELGAGVNVKTFQGSTPLHIATEMGEHETARVLIEELGATVDAKDSYGTTPLHVAARHGGTVITKWSAFSLGWGQILKLRTRKALRPSS